MRQRAVIFDLDGVIVSTDDCHYRAWKRMADEEGIYFDEVINQRLRGVSRMDSLEIILEKATRTYSPDEKKKLADRKNGYYRQLIQELTPDRILPGVMSILEGLRKEGFKVAVGSSSKNAPLILERIGLKETFDVVVGGNDITKSKPDPEVFLLAAERLKVDPAHCVVVEDADAGIEAALAADMRVIGVGAAAGNPRATWRAQALDAFSPAEFNKLVGDEKHGKG